MNTIDMLVYGSVAVLSCFVVWMIVQFMKEWPAYSRKNKK